MPIIDCFYNVAVLVWDHCLLIKLCFDIVTKLENSMSLLTLRDYGFLLSENHVIEEILKFFFVNIYYFE